MSSTCFDVLSRLFAADIDMDLLRQAAAKTPDERLLWLEGMQQFADDARKIAGTRLGVLTLEGLERAKRAAGRPKDLVDLGYILALKS